MRTFNSTSHVDARKGGRDGPRAVERVAGEMNKAPPLPGPSAGYSPCHMRLGGSNTSAIACGKQVRALLQLWPLCGAVADIRAP